MTKHRFHSDILVAVSFCLAAGCSERPALDSGPEAKPGSTNTQGGTAGAAANGVTGAGGSASTGNGGATAVDGGVSAADGATTVAPGMTVMNIPPLPSGGCPCSRASGQRQTTAGQSCPSGSGAKSDATIGPEGGALTMVTGTEGVTLELDVPAGALSAPTLISVIELADPTPAGFTDYTPIYAFEPVGLQLAAPARLRLPWDIVIPQGGELIIPRELSIYESALETTAYERLSDSYVNAGFSQASLTTLGYVFAGYPALPVSGCGQN